MPRKRVVIAVFTAVSLVTALTGAAASAEAASARPLLPVAAAEDIVSVPAPTSCGAGVMVDAPAAGAIGLDPGRVGASAAHSVVATANARHVTWMTSISCKITHTSATTTTTDSSNWSGYFTHDGTPTDVSAHWTIPNVTVASGTAKLSIWTGLGGWGHTQLDQAGTEQNQTYGDPQTNSFWWESVPTDAGEVDVLSLTAANGQSAGAETSYSGGIAHFTMCNYTLNNCVSVSQHEPTPAATADFIYERPENVSTKTYYRLAKFGTQTMSQAYWLTSDGTVHDPSTGSATKLNMNDGNPLATTDTSTGMNVTVVWKGYS